MWNWPSFSSVSVSYSISYSFQRVFQTLKWVLFLQVIFEILTFYFGFHTFHVYTHRHMYIHSVMCTSACKYMNISVLPFTCCFLLQLLNSSFLPCGWVVAQVCILSASLCLSEHWWGVQESSVGARKMATVEISILWYLRSKLLISFLWLRQASWRRAQDYSFAPWMGSYSASAGLIQPQPSGWKNLLKSNSVPNDAKGWKCIVKRKVGLCSMKKSNVPRKSSFLCLYLISSTVPRKFSDGFRRDGILTIFLLQQSIRQGRRRTSSKVRSTCWRSSCSSPSLSSRLHSSPMQSGSLRYDAEFWSTDVLGRTGVHSF